MKKPSILQLFFAKGWLWTIAFWGCALCIGIFFAMPTYLRQGGFVKTILAGALSGVIFSYLLLRGLYLTLLRARINGAPFHEGDIVLILTGKYRGQVASIYEVWEDRGQVRVDLGEQAKMDIKDVFTFIEVCRETNPKPVAKLERP